MDRLAHRIALVAAIVGGLSLTGCATVDSVKRAQSSADAAGNAAMHAQSTADAAGSAASAAGDAAKHAQDTADAAGNMASDGLKTTNERIDKLEKKVRWLAARHRHHGKKARPHKKWCHANKWHPNVKC